MNPLSSLPSVDVTTAAGDHSAVLLDVREHNEWSAGHAPNATHMPMSEIASRLSELDRTRRVVCVCRSGSRSSQVTAFLARQGFDAVNMHGGMGTWQRAGYPVVTDDGRPGMVI